MLQMKTGSNLIVLRNADSNDTIARIKQELTIKQIYHHIDQVYYAKEMVGR